jgi:drug/metabolite transporter (DMT)-like permease
MNRFKDYFMLHFIVLIWGFTAILGLLISVPAPVLVVYRTGLAAIGLAVVIASQGKSLKIQKFSPLLLTGCIVGLHWLLFFGSARVSNASICLAGMSTQALFTSFLEPIFNKKRINLLEIGLGMLVMIGLYLIFKFEFQYSLGLLMSIASSFFGSVFSVLNGFFAKKYEAEHVVFYEMSGAFLFSLFCLPFIIYLMPSEHFSLVPTLKDWLWLGILAWVCTIHCFNEEIFGLFIESYAQFRTCLWHHLGLFDFW